MATRLLVLYYSASGHTEAMARAIAEGAVSSGMEAAVRSVNECSVEDLPGFDGVCFGSPTYFSNMAWPVKKFIDESITLYRTGDLNDKVAGIFTSSGGVGDGEKCLTAFEWALAHHKMKIVLPGLVLAASEPREVVQERGREYGREIAGEMNQ